MGQAAQKPMVEPLEARVFLSAAGVTYVKAAASVHGLSVHRTAPAKHVRAHAAAPKNYLVSFYGLGGAGFGNQWLSKLATEAGKKSGSTTWKYLESQGDTALVKLLGAIDLNHDHVITWDEAGNVNVRVLGYSFGAIQGSNFARSLASVGQTVDGYVMQAAVPVLSLVAIDPVNYTPLKHTDGVPANVQNFTSFYEYNSGAGTIHLTNRKSGKSDGTASYSDAPVNPIGGSLPSQAQHSNQILVDFGGPWTNRVVTQTYNSRDNGMMTGAEVNHTTMPWYVYQDALGALI